MNMEFTNLQRNLIEEFKLRIGDAIDKAKFEDIYNFAKDIYEKANQENFLTQKEFALQYLQITNSAYKAMHGGFQNAKILKSYEIGEEEILAFRKKIIYENKLHRGEMKTYARLREIYDNNFLPLQEKEFFEKILDITGNSLRALITKTKKIEKEETRKNNIEKTCEQDNLEEKKKPETEILRFEEVSEEEIQRIRKECLRGELLHRKDKIKYSEFLRIYNKYYIPLSEEEFALKILDINKKAYIKIKFYPDKEAELLSTEVLPINIKQIRRQIMAKEQLHRGDWIDYKRFNEIVDNNYLPISRVDFASEFLDISATNLNSAKYDDNRKMSVLNKEEVSEQEIKMIRDFVIEKYRLHKNDEMTYEKFRSIYNSNYIPLSEKEFAQAILDISETSLNSIKYGTHDHIMILNDVKISKDEIKRLRQSIKAEYPIGKDIYYEDFINIYNRFFLPISKNEYSELVLEVSKEKLKSIRNPKKMEDSKTGEIKKVNLKTRIFLGEELEEFRQKIIRENYLYDGLEITRGQFMNLYKVKGHALSYMMFGDLILNVNPMQINALVLGRNRKVKISTKLEQDKNEQNKTKFTIIQENQIAQLLYEGKTTEEIIEELMLSKYDDVETLIKNVIAKKKLDENIIRKARVKNKLLEKVPLHKIPIKLKMNINIVKKTVSDIIMDEIQEQMKLGYDLEEAIELVRKKFVGDKEKNKSENDVLDKVEISTKEKRELKRKKELETRIEKILEKGQDITFRHEEYFREYIDLCKKRYHNRKSEGINLELLEVSLLFGEYDSANTEFFIRLCIKNQEYKRANGFISYYRYNEGVDYEEREKLIDLYYLISEAKKQSNAVKLACTCKSDAKSISSSTSIREGNVLDIQRKIKEGAVKQIMRELI